MTQRLIIRLIPLEILVLSILAGFLAVMSVRGLIGTTDVPAAAETAVAGAALAFAPVPAGGALSPIFTPEVQHWSDKILAWSSFFKIDPNLAATVMQIESCGAPGVVSSSGAQGLFQVMPFHFDAGEDMQDPDTNAGRGLAYLALGLTRASGNAGLALAGPDPTLLVLGNGHLPGRSRRPGPKRPPPRMAKRRRRQPLHHRQPAARPGPIGNCYRSLLLSRRERAGVRENCRLFRVPAAKDWLGLAPG